MLTKIDGKSGCALVCTMCNIADTWNVKLEFNLTDIDVNSLPHVCITYAKYVKASTLQQSRLVRQNVPQFRGSDEQRRPDFPWQSTSCDTYTVQACS